MNRFGGRSGNRHDSNQTTGAGGHEANLPLRAFLANTYNQPSPPETTDWAWNILGGQLINELQSCCNRCSFKMQLELPDVNSNKVVLLLQPDDDLPSRRWILSLDLSISNGKDKEEVVNINSVIVLCNEVESPDEVERYRTELINKLQGLPLMTCESLDDPTDGSRNIFIQFQELPENQFVTVVEHFLVRMH